MPYSTPTFEDIAMSSEIGEYQEDFGGDDPRFVELHSRAQVAAEAPARSGDE